MDWLNLLQLLSAYLVCRHFYFKRTLFVLFTEFSLSLELKKFVQKLQSLVMII